MKFTMNRNWKCSSILWEWSELAAFCRCITPNLLMERARYGDTAMWAFLDIFTHRAVSMFFRAWEKYRFPVGYERGEDDFTDYSFRFYRTRHKRFARQNGLGRRIAFAVQRSDRSKTAFAERARTNFERLFRRYRQKSNNFSVNGWI